METYYLSYSVIVRIMEIMKKKTLSTIPEHSNSQLKKADGMITFSSIDVLAPHIGSQLLDSKTACYILAYPSPNSVQ